MDDELRELLDEFSPEIRRLSLSLRSRVRDLVPDAEEKLLRGYKSLGYGFGSGMKDRFAAISPLGSLRSQGVGRWGVGSREKQGIKTRTAEVSGRI